jgi:hypothetical protein
MLGSPASSSVVTDHTQVQIIGAGSNGVGGPGKATYELTEMGTTSAALAESGTGTGNALQIVSSSAATSPFGPSLMRLEANAYDNGKGDFISGGASANGRWRDIIFYSGDQTLSSLTLVFHAEGTFSADLLGSYYKYYGRTGLSIEMSPDIDAFPDRSYTDRASVGYSIGNDAEGWTHEGFDSFTYDPSNGHFSGTFTFDAPYDAEKEGYTWYVAMTASASAKGGSASALLGNTISLVSVSSTDGDSIDSADLSFDSGLKISAVPEPTSLVMLSVGLVSALTYCRKRAGSLKPSDGTTAG